METSCGFWSPLITTWCVQFVSSRVAGYRSRITVLVQTWLSNRALTDCSGSQEFVHENPYKQNIMSTLRSIQGESAVH